MPGRAGERSFAAGRQAAAPPSAAGSSRAACAGGSAATARSRRARARRIPCAGRGGRAAVVEDFLDLDPVAPGHRQPVGDARVVAAGCLGWIADGMRRSQTWSGSAARDPGRAAGHRTQRPVRSGDLCRRLRAGRLFRVVRAAHPFTANFHILQGPGGSSAGRRILPIRGGAWPVRIGPPARARTT